MQDEAFYFNAFESKLSKAIEYFGKPPIWVIAKYADKIRSMEYYSHYINELLTKDILLSHPSVVRLCKDWVISGHRMEQFYDLQRELDVGDAELYSVSIRLFITWDFSVPERHYLKFYKLLNQYLTASDFDALAKSYS